MRVLLVTSDREQCGIREYGRMLQAGLQAQGVEVVEWPYPSWPSGPYPYLPAELGTFDILHVNHHAALHASWNDDTVQAMRLMGWKVVVTQHDTYEKLSIMKERGMPLFRSADAWVVHEEVEGLEGATALRQGVLPKSAYTKVLPGPRPTLGLFGFPFPWKNFELATELAREAGWDVVILSAGAKLEEMRWADRLGVTVVTPYLSAENVVELLSTCTATAFLYQNGNSGTSGAIRFGLAARRPVVAFRCRQFRDLYNLPGVWWAENERDFRHFLSIAVMPEVATIMEKGVEFIADRCSWEKVAEAYKEIYQQVLAKGKGE